MRATDTDIISGLIRVAQFLFFFFFFPMCWRTYCLLKVMCFGAPTVQLVGETAKGPKYPTEVGCILKSEKQVLSFFLLLLS